MNYLKAVSLSLILIIPPCYVHASADGMVDKGGLNCSMAETRGHLFTSHGVHSYTSEPFFEPGTDIPIHFYEKQISDDNENVDNYLFLHAGIDIPLASYSTNINDLTIEGKSIVKRTGGGFSIIMGADRLHLNKPGSSIFLKKISGIYWEGSIYVYSLGQAKTALHLLTCYDPSQKMEHYIEGLYISLLKL